MSRFVLVAAAALTAILLSPGFAHEYSVGTLKIGHPWARATPKGAPVGGGYMTVTNTGSAPDRLVSGASDISSRFEIHEMSMDNGVMKMRPVSNGIEIKPGQTIELKPGGYHVMFIGLKKGLQEGQRVKATLQFEKAGKVDVEFAVESIGAQSPGPGGGGDHDMPGMKMNH